MQKSTIAIILVIVTTVYSLPLLTVQSSVAQTDNITLPINTSLNGIKPDQQIFNQKITDVKQNNSIANELFEKSGTCNLEGKSLHCGLAENITGSMNNVILDKSIRSALPNLSTSFRINEINNTASNNVAILYTLPSQTVEKYAGINIFNNSIYAIFYNFESGKVNADPNWPGQLTNLTWKPGTLFNMSIINQKDSVDLVINGTTYYSQPMGKAYNQQGYAGLYYDYINNIEFYSFNNITTSTPTITQDTSTILLGGHHLPDGSYMHLYDSAPYEIRSGHLAAKVPCNDDNSTDVIFLMGHVPKLNPVKLEFVAPLSESGEICLYHGDILSTVDDPITDIAIKNNSTEDDIDFPETSSIVVTVNGISKLAYEG